MSSPGSRTKAEAAEAASVKGPDFIIAGTQKAGTTWLEHHLVRRPDVHTPRRQLHFFDRNFERGPDWYRTALLRGGPPPPGALIGEKSTEYFDPLYAAQVARRIAGTCPDANVIVILRNPVTRALSALRHHVNSGLEPIPADPDAVLFADRDRPAEQGFRYVERGFYAGQMKAFLRAIPPERFLVLIFEEDIIADPVAGYRRTCEFLGLDAPDTEGLGQPVNSLRLSVPSIRLSHALYHVPYARGAIRRIDRALHLRPWNPVFKDETIARLRALYAEDIAELEVLLGRRIPLWRKT